MFSHRDIKPVCLIVSQRMLVAFQDAKAFQKFEEAQPLFSILNWIADRDFSKAGEEELLDAGRVIMAVEETVLSFLNN